MYTVIESETFTKEADALWADDERGEFFAWLALNPGAGDVIPGSGGCRKVRWARRGMGKRGGVRAVYLNQLPDGVIYLLAIYAKAVRGNIPAHILKSIAEAIKDV
jgi:hypothetical protein